MVSPHSEEVAILTMDPGDDAVFADLGISKKEFPAVPTTWD